MSRPFAVRRSGARPSALRPSGVRPPTPRGARRLRPRTVALVALVLVAATAAVLLSMGRVPICTCGTVKLWWGETMSAENSQHLSDWYSPSHLIHGFLFFLAGWLVLRRAPLGGRFLVALAVECGWEMLENTDWVIGRYREATVSLDYFGDSVVNSLSDIGFMALGFFLASRLPVWATVLLAVGFEALTAIVIRDNLTLNVLMLAWPVEAVKAWQAAG